MTSNRNVRQLAPGYSAEFDTVDEPTWCRLLMEFDDANIYQTWSYAAVMGGRRNMSQLILRKDGEVVAIAQARIARLPLVKVGIAYIFWGPLWRRGENSHSEEIFRQAIRALRAEYVCKRKLALRLFPLLFDLDSPSFLDVLKEEGFSSAGSEPRSRTILMNLAFPIEQLREGMKPHWRRELKVAEKCGLELVEGSGEVQFAAFIDIYREMVLRKQFVESNDINKFRLIQAQLPEPLKMKVLLCRSGENVCAGLICSAIGKTALYLFGATSNAGMKSRGSYFLQWRLIDQLRKSGIVVYDLNGINPEKNPGTYKFKSDFGGANSRDASFLGRFDSHGSLLSHLCVQLGDMMRLTRRSLKELVKSVRTGKARPSLAG
jgi:hypothetical protein